MSIHPTAIIHNNAQIGKDVEVGPYSIIEENVIVGQRVKISAHAHILKNTSIGDDCQIHMGALLGHLPQIRDIQDQQGRLVIGQRNIFREYVTVHRSSQKSKSTTIGDDNYFMAFSHIAHDCSIGNHVTVCNGALLAGHVLVEDYAFISGNVTVHQFCRIGRLAMVGGLTRVAKDVPPYMLVKGDSSVWAINSVGLKRANFPVKLRSQIKTAFKLLYRSGLNVRQALEQLQNQNQTEELRHLIEFVQGSNRGICSYKSPSWWQRIRQLAPSQPKQLPAYQAFQMSRKAQEPLAVTLLIVFIILAFVLLNRPLRENLQHKYRTFFGAMNQDAPF